VLASATAIAGAACGSKHTTTTFATSDPTQLRLAPGQPIKIAAMLGYQDLGAAATDPEHAIQLAASQRGSIDGHSIEVVAVDDGCFNGFNGGAAAAAAVLVQGDVVGVVGTSCSGSAFGAEGGLCGADIPMISPSDTNPALTDPATHQRCYFRTSYSDAVQGQRMADYARTAASVTRAATIFQDGNAYSTALEDTFVADFADASHVVSARVPIALGSGSLTSAADAALAAVIAADPDVQFVFFPMQDSGPATAIVVEARNNAAFNGVHLASGDATLVTDFLTNAGAAALTPPAVVVSGPALVFPGAAFQKFVSDFTASFGAFPAEEAFLPHAYDAANVLLDAIALVAEDQGGTLVISRPALVSAVYATSGFVGTTGTLSADQNGDLNPDPSVEVFQVASDGAGGSKFNAVFP
jgi:branched-chain amino acid transport system substrate-binding protein